MSSVRGSKPAHVDPMHSGESGAEKATPTCLKKGATEGLALHGQEPLKTICELTNHGLTKLTLVWTRNLLEWKGRTELRGAKGRKTAGANNPIRTV